MFEDESSVVFNHPERPYHGLGIRCIILLGGTVLILLFLFWRMASGDYPSDRSIYESHFYSGLFGSLNSLVCLIAGLLKPSFKIVSNRVKTFFEDLSISFFIAASGYRDDIKSRGVAFWILCLCILINNAIMVFGLLGYLHMENLM